MAQFEASRRESLEARVAGVAEQVAASAGLEIVLVEVKGGGNRSVVRAFIDKPGGVSLNDCERFSKNLSVLLDVEDCIPFSYILEVSSPGLDRPLTKESDFERFSGKRAKVRTRVPIGGQRNFKGSIVGVKEGRIELEITPGKLVEIALSDIEKANLLIEI
jgi:ribosome maturation factor RimP